MFYDVPRILPFATKMKVTSFTAAPRCSAGATLKAARLRFNAAGPLYISPRFWPQSMLHDAAQNPNSGATPRHAGLALMTNSHLRRYAIMAMLREIFC